MKRLFLSATAALMLSTSAHAVDLNNMSAEDRAAFGAAVRAYLMENPQVIMEAVEALEQRQQQDQVELDRSLVSVNAEELFNDGYSWQGGNLNGDLTLVEFVDYRCGYCRRAHDEVAALIESDGNIRLIVKELPILGPDSVTSARFAIAVKQLHGDDAYKAAHDALIALTSDANPVALKRIAESLGFDGDAILAHADSDAVTEVISNTRALASRLQISGTPTFVLQNEMIRGFVPKDAMHSIVASIRG